MPGHNRIEQDHRATKRRVRPMLGFKTADSTRAVLRGIEMVHMIRNCQAKYSENPSWPPTKQFKSLVA
jgi:putative transposase